MSSGRVRLELLPFVDAVKYFGKVGNFWFKLLKFSIFSSALNVYRFFLIYQVDNIFFADLTKMT